MWRDLPAPWVGVLRECKGLPMAEQHARLMEMDRAHV